MDQPDDKPARQDMGDNHGQRILVIDDDPFVLQLMVKLINVAGFCATPAASGTTGLALFRSQPFDLVLTDLVMPDGDGLLVLSTIARENPELPVIIVSGAGSLQDSIQALRLGAWDYISKPVDRDLLIHQIGKALERARLLKENVRYRQGLEAEVAKRTAQLNRRSEELEQANRSLQNEISTRQRIEDDLKKAMEEWQTTFDSMSDFISLHDRNYTIVKANKTLCQFLGKAPEEIIGQKCCQVFHGSYEPWSNCPHREMMASGQTHTAEVIDSRLGIPLLITASPLRSNGEIIGSIHVAKDISRQKTLEAERQKNKNLESISVLCGGLAHDFNNLLTALGGYIDLARMEKDPEGVPHWLGHAKMVTNLAAELTKQLLTFSKGGTPIFKHVAVATLINDCLERTGNIFHQVQTKIDIARDIWPIKGDHGQLLTVIKNIFYNAAEAMPNGGVLTIEAKNIAKGKASWSNQDAMVYTTSLREEASDQSPLGVDAVLLRFTDQGVGINPEILGKIFDPYFTTSAKGATKGKGLGLALCHAIITKHHGQIAVSSQKEQGTTISIYLPASPAVV